MPGRLSQQSQKSHVGAGKGHRLRVKIAIDFDGVCFDLVGSLGGLPGTPLWQGERLTLANCTGWRTVFDVFRGICPPEQLEHYSFARMDEARSLERLREQGLFPGSQPALQALRELGLEPVILTHNSAAAIEAIRSYLDELGLGLAVISASPEEKIAWCLAEGAALLVDDAPATILLAVSAGIIPLSPRYLYNAEAIDAAGSRFSTDGWTGLLAHVRQHYAAAAAA